MRAGIAIALAAGALSCASPAGTPVALPDAEPGIGFDDLRYSSALHRVLVPAGRSGRLDLIDPDTLAVTSIAGLGATPDYSGGHDDGPTSVDEGLGKLFVTDRTTDEIVVIDPASAMIVARARVASGPDYVRFVAATNELWVSEPSGSEIEIFALDAAASPSHAASIRVDNGPESLVVDGKRGRAYVHRWQASTLAFDVKTRELVAEWPNGCAASRGIAIDEERGFLFAGCNEGTTSVLDLDHDGAMLSTIARGSGFDVIGYSSSLGHLYLAGDACACLVILGVSAAGELRLVDRLRAPSRAHCATADDVNHAWVCDPAAGGLLRVDDPYGPSF